MNKKFKLKKSNERGLQMLGIISVILATLVSFAYLMPENSTATETAFYSVNGTVPSVTTTVSSVTSATTATTVTTTTTASVVTSSTSASSATTVTSSTTTTTQTVSSTTQTTTSETQTTVSTAPEIVYTAESDEIPVSEYEKSSSVVISSDGEFYEESDRQYDDDSETSGERIYLGTFKITHYCACSICCGEYTGLTASGEYATAGRTVSASSAFDFGTKLEIDGHVYVVEDRGGFSGDTIDIFCDSHEEALEKGSYYTDVYIIQE